ncbi:MAG: hypothetical protein KKA12_08620, partial [Alphaproteobacteria bacterium]|nr:hypothetical protein [Alphaproteobacteria bacterium]
RSAADRIAQANDDVVRSWEQRTAEIEAKAGLEGAALKAVEQQQEVEAAIRRINTELIDKEVEARRKAALAARRQFDAGKATADATAEVQRQQDSVRGLAERYVEASDAIAEFSRRQSEAKAVLEGLKSPMEKINDEIDQAITLLRAHALTTDQFAARMDQLALAMAKANIEADAGKRIWVGFGDDVGRTLTDLVLHGGSALDVLQKLIQLPLERLLYQTVEQPIARGIDSLLGVNVDKNAAAIKSGLPDAQTLLGASVSIGTLGSSADAAAAALARLTGTSGTFGTGPGLQSTFLANDNGFTDAVARPLADVGSSAAKAGQAMAELIPLTGQFGGALGQAIAMLSSGGGGGGGILGAVLGIAGSALGGGITAAGVARLAPSAASTIATNPALFASGTDNLPIGRPFWVGENGREKMIRQAGGQVSVLSNQQAHRPAEGGGGGITIIQNNIIPARADPRTTQSAIARGNQRSQALAARKGIA